MDSCLLDPISVFKEKETMIALLQIGVNRARPFDLTTAPWIIFVMAFASWKSVKQWYQKRREDRERKNRGY